MELNKITAQDMTDLTRLSQMTDFLWDKIIADNHGVATARAIVKAATPELTRKVFRNAS